MLRLLRSPLRQDNITWPLTPHGPVEHGARGFHGQHRRRRASFTYTHRRAQIGFHMGEMRDASTLFRRKVRQRIE